METGEKRSFWWAVGSLIFGLVFGSLLHFVWEWSGKMTWIAAFAPVSESPWEHLKLLTTPLFLATVLESFFRPGTGLPDSRLAGTLIGMLTILTGYYLYSGAFGLSHLIWLDIVLFAAAVFLAVLFGRKWEKPLEGWALAGWIGWAVLLVLMVFLTWYPPEIPLFRDSITGLYGI